MFSTMSQFSLKLTFILLTLGSSVSQQSGDWLCADEKCSEPIGTATVLKPYLVADSGSKIIVNKGDKVQILRRPRQPNEKHYWVKSLVSNKEGLLLKSNLMIQKQDVKDTNLIPVTTENPRPNDGIKPSAPTQVLDGTTLYGDYHQVNPPYSNQPTSDNQSQNSETAFPSTAPPSDATDTTSYFNDTDSSREKIRSTSTEPSLPINILKELTNGEELGISSTPASSMSPSSTPTPDVQIPEISVASPVTKDAKPLPLVEKQSQLPENTTAIEKHGENENFKSGESTPVHTEEMHPARSILSKTVGFLNDAFNREAPDEVLEAIVSEAEDLKDSDSKTSKEEQETSGVIHTEYSTYDPAKTDMDKLTEVVSGSTIKTHEQQPRPLQPPLEDSPSAELPNSQSTTESPVNTDSNSSYPSNLTSGNVEPITHREEKMTFSVSNSSGEIPSTKTGSTAPDKAVEVPSIELDKLPKKNEESSYQPDIIDSVPGTLVPSVETEISSTASPIELNETDETKRFGRKVLEGEEVRNSGGNDPLVGSDLSDSSSVTSPPDNQNFEGDSENANAEVKAPVEQIIEFSPASEPQIAQTESSLSPNDPSEFTPHPGQDSVLANSQSSIDGLSQSLNFGSTEDILSQPYSPDLVPEERLEQEPWYSSILNLYSSLQQTFSSSPLTDEVTAIPEYPAKEEPAKREDQIRSYDDRPDCNSMKEVADDWSNYLYVLSPQHIFVLALTTLTVLAFSLGLYYLENHRRDVELVKKYNDLAGKLFIEQKEKEMLTQQLATANDTMTKISFDTTRYDEEISQLKALAEKYKTEKTTAEAKEKESIKKHVIVEKNYNELRKVLSQNKQKGERTALIADIQNLKDSITANNIEIASLKEQLIEKKEEIKVLNSKTARLIENHKQLEKTLENTISSNHEAALKYQDSIANLEKSIEESTAARVKLENECTQLKKEKETISIEKEILESSLQKYQRLQPSQSLDEWLDAKEVRVTLLACEKKIDEFKEKEDALVKEKSTLQDKLRVMQNDIEQLNENYEKAEKEKVEAFTRLQVLSDYFKEKETQLQEELGTKEAFWVQKQSEDRTIYEQMRALREENASVKKQNENLKHEILEQEASFKKLITSAEDKAHENWVALRHNERRLKETQVEAAQLRARLTALEAPDNTALELNGDGGNGVNSQFGPTTSPPPPFMMFHPQPGDFVPPPPLVPLPPSPSSRLSRPPPLGRISSPPPMVGDFTPPPPLVPYGMFMPPSASPPLPHVIQKPQPLMDGVHHRTQTDSQSSNHSSDSTPDKPRRSKR